MCVAVRVSEREKTALCGVSSLCLLRGCSEHCASDRRGNGTLAKEWHQNGTLQNGFLSVWCVVWVVTMAQIVWKKGGRCSPHTREPSSPSTHKQPLPHHTTHTHTHNSLSKAISSEQGKDMGSKTYSYIHTDTHPGKKCTRRGEAAKQNHTQTPSSPTSAFFLLSVPLASIEGAVTHMHEQRRNDKLSSTTTTRRRN